MPDVVAQITAGVVVLLAVTASYKVGRLRRGSLPAQFALAAVFVCLALGLLPFTQWYRDLVHGQSALGWGQVTARVLVVLAASAAQSYLLLLAQPFAATGSKVLHRLGAGGAVSASLVVMALLTPPPAFGTPPLDVWPEVLTHVVFQLFLTVALADVAVASARWSLASSDVMRLGLLLVAAGAALGIVYAVGKVVATFLELAAGRNEAVVATFQLIALGGLVLVAVGSVLPGLVRSARSTRRTVAAHRDLDRLYPLWSDLVQVVPGIALEPVEPRWRDRLHVRDLDLRLYRRVIELRDGELALAGPRGRAAEAMATAVGLRGALEAARPLHRGPATVHEEVAWWAEVSTSYTEQRDAHQPAVLG